MLLFVKRLCKGILVASEFSPVALFWMAKSFLFDMPRSWWARRKLPGLAVSMGLRHEKSRYIKEFGKIKGKVKGHFVKVEPFASMNPTARVSFRQRHRGMEISLRRPDLVPEKGAIEFTSSLWWFNQIFRTRVIHRDKMENVSGNTPLLQDMVSFYERWMFSLDSLLVSDDDIFCRFRYGFYFFPHIPASRFQGLVQDMVDLAERIDVALEGP